MPILQQNQSILKNIPGAPYRHIATLEKENGMIFGVDYSTVSQSRARLKAELKSSRNFRAPDLNWKYFSGGPDIEGTYKICSKNISSSEFEKTISSNPGTNR